MMKTLKAFWNDEQGVTAIEYGLLAGLIAVVVIGGATLAGTEVNAMFTKVANTLKPLAA